MAQDIEVDVRSAIYDLRRQFKHLADSSVNLAIARAINHTLAKAKTSASKDVRTRYKVKASDIKKTMVTTKANRSTQTGYIRVSASPLPIFSFGARQTKKGVTVNVIGKRKLIKSAFIAMGRRGGRGTSMGVGELGSSGHKGVFVRGAYKGTDLTYRTKRMRKAGPDLPIEEVMTASPYSMITHASVQQKVAEKIESSFATRLLHELKRM